PYSILLHPLPKITLHVSTLSKLLSPPISHSKMNKPSITSFKSVSKSVALRLSPSPPPLSPITPLILPRFLQDVLIRLRSPLIPAPIHQLQRWIPKRISHLSSMRPQKLASLSSRLLEYPCILLILSMEKVALLEFKFIWQ